MPAFASKRQFRLMMAILHGKKKGRTARGDSGPPKSIAEKYSGKADDLPESKNKEHEGGVWTDSHHKKHAEDKSKKVKKTLQALLDEELNKNIIRTDQAADVVHEMSHADALTLVGNGLFRYIKDFVKDMKDDTIKDIPVGSHTLTIRKHVNDVYSGSVRDGHKQVHHFVNRSLPAVIGELMSVFEWYLPEDMPNFKVHEDDKLDDKTIEDGLGKLIDNYHKYNIADIYDEMESIRTEIRQGNAVDLQVVEQKIMSLFDKLEDRLGVAEKQHNALATAAGKEIDEIERKLKNLQNTVEDMQKQPSKVEAITSEDDISPGAVYRDMYSYLTRPRVTIHPGGRITIDFAADWPQLEKESFLRDLKAKALRSKK